MYHKTLLISVILIVLHNADIGCTQIQNDNTCYILKNYSFDKDDGDIICDDTYPNCIIDCETKESCGENTWTGGNGHTIKCPFNGISCIINCDGEQSCPYVYLNSSNTEDVYLNIRGIGNVAKKMEIYAPSDGNLYINVNNTDAQFLNNNIYSTLNTQNIFINCTIIKECRSSNIYTSNIAGNFTFVCGLKCDNWNIDISSIGGHADINCDNGDCHNMNIDASLSEEGELDISCNNILADCRSSNVYCPKTEHHCNLWCTLCDGMKVYSYNGIIDVNWWCNNSDNNVCNNAELYCGPNQDDYRSKLEYDLGEWIYEPDTICGYLTKQPTSNPSNQPSTIPSMNPTIDPTTIPSINPSENPTMNPTEIPTKYPSIDPTQNPIITTNPSIYPTIIPTTDPTYDPSANPTSNPSRHPSIIPTAIPSTHPTLVPTIIIVTEVSAKTTNEGLITTHFDTSLTSYIRNFEENKDNSNTIVLIGIMVSISCCCCIAFGIMLYIVCKRNKQILEMEMDNRINRDEILNLNKNAHAADLGPFKQNINKKKKKKKHKKKRKKKHRKKYGNADVEIEFEEHDEGDHIDYIETPGDICMSAIVGNDDLLQKSKRKKRKHKHQQEGDDILDITPQ